MFGSSEDRAERKARKEQRRTDWVHRLRELDAHAGYGRLNASDRNHRLLAYTAASAIAVEELLAAQQETNRLLAELVAQGQTPQSFGPGPMVPGVPPRHGR